MQKSVLLIGIVVVVAVLGGFFFMSGKSPVQPMATPVEVEESETMVVEDEQVDATAEANAMEKTTTITIDVKPFSFAPAVIEAKAGETITVTLTNSEGMHDFVIEELSVASKKLTQGQTDTFEIKIPEDATGKSYEFYCSVGNHRQQGMVGTLKVL